MIRPDRTPGLSLADTAAGLVTSALNRAVTAAHPFTAPAGSAQPRTRYGDSHL